MRGPSSVNSSLTHITLYLQVQWDMGQRHTYRTGKGGKFDLLLLDSSPSGKVKFEPAHWVWVFIALESSADSDEPVFFTTRTYSQSFAEVDLVQLASPSTSSINSRVTFKAQLKVGW